MRNGESGSENASNHPSALVNRASGPTEDKEFVMQARTMLRKRTVIAALACGTASVVVAGSGLAAGASPRGQGDTHSHRTLTLYQTGGVLPDPGPAPSDQGTQFVGGFNLHLDAIDGPIVGHAVKHCIFEPELLPTEPSKMVLCYSMHMVPGGALATTGLNPRSNLSANPDAITGGTGTYRAANGQVTVTPAGVPGSFDSKLVFDLGN